MSKRKKLIPVKREKEWIKNGGKGGMPKRDVMTLNKKTDIKKKGNDFYPLHRKGKKGGRAQGRGVEYEELIEEKTR